MTSLVLSLTLSLALLASLLLISLYNLKVVRPSLEALKLALDSLTKIEKERSKALSQALNLLAAKEPMAYQMLQAAEPAATQPAVYNGLYVTGDEYQQLLQDDKRLTDLWKTIEEGTEE